MQSIYGEDLAYIHAQGFGGLARGARPEILRRIKSAAIPIRHVVELGCGSGILAAALSEAGFDVTGVDRSAALLGKARLAAPRAQLVHASLYDFELPACGAIVALGEPLTYHAEGSGPEGSIQEFFRRAAQALPVGGLLIFDLIETGEPSLTARSWASGEDWAILARTDEDSASRTLVREMETFRKVEDRYRRGHEVHRVRVFDTSEVCAWLETCGFETETAQCYGWQPLAPRRRAFFARLVQEASISIGV